MYKLKFTIQELPLTINRMGNMHWAKRAKYVKDWHMKVRLAIGQNVPKLPLQKAKLTLTRHSDREPDFDNLAHSFKCVIDGLTNAGIILDDKPSIIGSPTFRWKKAKRNEGFISVEVSGTGSAEEPSPE